jgi:protein xylosyltransferase
LVKKEPKIKVHHQSFTKKLQNPSRPGGSSSLTNDDEDIIHSNNLKQVPRQESRNHKNFLQGFNLTQNCDTTKIANNRETVSAIHRAKSQECKKHILDIACAIESGTFYPKELPNYCPSKNYISSRSLGCFKDEKKFRILSGYYTNFKESNSPKKCIQMCLQSGFFYSGVEYS